MKDQDDWIDLKRAEIEIYGRYLDKRTSWHLIKSHRNTNLETLQRNCTWWAKCVDAAALERDAELWGGWNSPHMHLLKMALENFFCMCRKENKWIEGAEPHFFFNADTPSEFSGTLRFVMVYLNKDLFEQCIKCWLPVSYRGVNRDDVTTVSYSGKDDKLHKGKNEKVEQNCCNHASFLKAQGQYSDWYTNGIKKTFC
jgi:hypothetical protein